MSAADDESVSRSVIPLPANADAPMLARAFVARHGDELAPDLLADALLLVSELATNAVRYGRPEITLELRLHPPGIGVALSDAGPQLPTRPARPPSPEQTSGRGLMIVDALSSQWGVTEIDQPPGKTVWFDLGPV